MDAISFVLGVKSAQLRSSQLKDLVYRGRRLARGPFDGSEDTQGQDDAEQDNEGEGEGDAKKAWVLAVYEDEDKKEWLFQRTCVVCATLASVRASHRPTGSLPQVHPSIVSMIGPSRMPPTIPRSLLITSLSRRRISSFSRVMLKPSPPNHQGSLPDSSNKFLVPSSWRQITRKQKRHRSEQPRTLRSISRREGVLLVKYDNIKNRRGRRNASKVFVKNG